MRSLCLAIVLFTFLGCGDDDDGVSSEADARSAYLGLDKAVGRALKLGFAGFNAASSANIPTQMEAGDAMGQMRVDGQVDQGASSNKGMRLDIRLTDYSDGGAEAADGGGPLLADIIYSTQEADPPFMNLTLRNIPDGTLTGSLSGDFDMRGSLSGVVTLELAFSGEIEDGSPDGVLVRRKVGTTSITGVARSDFGEYAVSITR